MLTESRYFIEVVPVSYCTLRCTDLEISKAVYERYLKTKRKVTSKIFIARGRCSSCVHYRTRQKHNVKYTWRLQILKNESTFLHIYSLVL